MQKLSMFKEATSTLEQEIQELLSEPSLEKEYQSWLHHPITQVVLKKMQLEYAGCIESFFALTGDQEEDTRKALQQQKVALVMENLINFIRTLEFGIKDEEVEIDDTSDWAQSLS